MLQQASELEHALCCEYLYAAFTLKQGGDPDLAPSQAALAQQWGQQITKIAIEEMYHLMLASNLLTAVGAKPHLWRPNFPQPSTRFSDVGLPSLLTHFDDETAKRFMCWEKPEIDGWWIEDCKSCAQQAHAAHALPAAVEAPAYDSIGALYGLIDTTLKANPQWIDPSTAPSQLTSALVPFSPKVAPITTYDEASAYIEIIVTEGEGAPDWESKSHFAYFHQIVVELDGVDAGKGMSWPALANPVYDEANVVPGANLIDDPVAGPIGLAFNDLYLVFVRMLARLFIPDDESDTERQALANAATAVMPLVLKPLGVLLTRLPAGGDHAGRHAGPSFELPPSLELPLGRCAEAVGALGDDLAAVAARLQVLSIETQGLAAAARVELATIAARLQTLLPLMRVDARPVPS